MHPLRFWQWLTVLLLCCLQALALAASREPCPTTANPSAAEWKALPAKARDHGLLWKISKGGHSSWLYGTLHVGKPQWFFPGPQLRAALAASDHLMLELDPTAPATAAAMQDRSRWGLGFAELPAPLQDRLLQEVRRACLPEEIAGSMSVAMLGVTLQVLEARRIGLDAAFGSEMMLLQQAKAAGKPLLTLETAREQFDLFEGIPRQDMLAMLPPSLEQLRSRALLKQTARLAESWARGDAADLASYETWCDCVNTAAERAFMARLGPERNRRMAPNIDAAHRSGKRLFVAVGALHLVGRDGLPALLQQQGYTVERIAFAP
ncbi:TraB/GumN family protein [Chitinilyticum litopenaei]|uniref:TraB/GumN family protein n=1 Tax=Chitinilyticum litopenaei TaxID=1121276 RepID=UPI00048B7527|nr:TraB/GumN family protein [Chitinilyticum litopenaei]